MLINYIVITYIEKINNETIECMVYSIWKMYYNKYYTTFENSIGGW